MLLTHIKGLITLLITTHEPPSTVVITVVVLMMILLRSALRQPSIYSSVPYTLKLASFPQIVASLSHDRVGVVSMANARELGQGLEVGV